MVVSCKIFLIYHLLQGICFVYGCLQKFTCNCIVYRREVLTCKEAARDKLLLQSRHLRVVMCVRRESHTQLETYALFVSALMFSGKQVIFQRTFFGKLSHFPVFGNDLENGLENVFQCLVCINIFWKTILFFWKTISLQLYHCNLCGSGTLSINTKSIEICIVARSA